MPRKMNLFKRRKKELEEPEAPKASQQQDIEEIPLPVPSPDDATRLESTEEQTVSKAPPIPLTKGTQPDVEETKEEIDIPTAVKTIIEQADSKIGGLIAQLFLHAPLKPSTKKSLLEQMSALYDEQYNAVMDYVIGNTEQDLIKRRLL